MVECQPSKLFVAGSNPVTRSKLRNTMYKESIEDIQHKFRCLSQDMAAQAITNKQYIVGSVDQDGGFSIAKTPVIHTTAHQARQECSRLAGQFPGKIYIMLKLDGAELVPANNKVSW